MLAGSSGLVGFPDKHIFLSIKPDRIEAQVPLEVKPSDATDNFSAARGRIILELQNPANVQEINAAREASVGAIVPRPNQQTAQYQWRVVRIESDLVVKQYKPNNNSGPGGM
jgi:hypothetical protein